MSKDRTMGMYLFKLRRHFTLICKHKWYVFLACCECGIPLRGLFHDMSKFSIPELFSSAKYYNGSRSPIDEEKDEKGYSYAWLHHRGRNPHHWEYWIDNLSDGGTTIMIPMKYVKEMICDWIGAGKAYNGVKNWDRKQPYEFYKMKKSAGKIKLNPYTEELVEFVLSVYGTKSQLTLKELFKKDVMPQPIQKNSPYFNGDPNSWSY